MFHCFACGLCMESNIMLIDHVRKFHMNLSAYRCSELNCDRTYSVFNSYYSHRKREHGVNAETPNNDESIHKNNHFYYINDEVNVTNSPNISGCDNLNEKVNEDILEVHDEYQESTDSDEFLDNDVTAHKSSDQLNDFYDLLRLSATKLASKLNSFSDLPRKRVEMLIKDFTSFLNSDCINLLRDTIFDRLNSLNDNPENKLKIQSMFNLLQNPFESFNTSYKSFKYFELLGTFIRPIHQIIGYRDEYRMKQGLTILTKVPLTLEFVPIRQVLFQFFKLPCVLNDTLEYIKSLENGKIIHNYIQGDFWKNEIRSNGRTILPIALHFDDYENNNPLGCHRGIQKCGALYFSILCLPPKYRSKLSNIFLFLLVNSLDRKVVSKSEVFRMVMKELIFLEKTGITVENGGEKIQIYFKLALILGDNLGLHELFGLVESFSANYFCRFCLINKNDINKVFNEKSCTLRNKDNYNEGLRANNVATTGIKERCYFHKLSYFHFTENLSADVMHDFLEGVCQYDLALIFDYFIKNLDLELIDINALINSFCYSYHDRRNKPPEILVDHLKNQRIIIYAAEMLSLIRNLTLIIGHLIPENFEHWNLVLQLTEITTFFTARFHQYGHCDYLNCIINEYLYLRNQLFPNTMKPKHHFLVHYCRIMKSSGPLWHLSSMRYESKNKEAKTISHASVNRINICNTIATKHQLKLNHYFNFFQPPLDFTPGPKEKDNFSIRNNFSILFPSVINTETIVEHKYIEFNTQHVVANTILVDGTANGPIFYVVKYIFTEEINRVLIIAEYVKCSFEQHYYAFKIRKYTKKYKCLTWNEVRTTFVINKLRSVNGNEYISKRWL